jgi:hypothetical protein
LTSAVTHPAVRRRRPLPAWPAGRPLRAWQEAAAAAVHEHAGESFLASATPAAGDDEGVSRADFAYGYTDALLDGVCRPVTFHTYGGEMEWMSDGRRRSADFSIALPAVEAARRLPTALGPDGDWMTHVLRDAHAELASIRAGTHPEAGGLAGVGPDGVGGRRRREGR